MKKTLLILACAACGASMNAQMSVVKDAEKAMKSGKDYTEVYDMIKPAMSDAETANLAITYYIPGKAGFKQYDNLLGRKQLGMLKDGEGLVMATALLGGYDNFVKVLPLDSVADAKGKIKTKYSKEVVNTVAGHYNDFTDIAAEFWNANDFKNAYRSWDIFCKLSQNPEQFGIKAHPDSVVSQYMFNRSLALWKMDDKEGSAKSFREAAEYGYSKPEVYEYGMAVALEAKDNDALFFFAQKGNELYGKDDNQYVNNIINYYLREEKYDEAVKYLDEAIAANPGNAQYYALEGIIFDSKKDPEKSMACYQKSLELDPENGLANFYYGRALLLKAGEISDTYTGPVDQFAAFKDAQIVPVLKDGVKYLEKAYQVDPNNRTEILRALAIGYYNLDDEAGQEDVKRRQLED